MTSTINLLPNLSGKPNFGPENGIIRDIIIGLQPSQYTSEACPLLRIIIDLPHESKVIKLTPSALKNLNAIFGKTVASWIGQRVTVHRIMGKPGLCILPVIV